MDKDFFGRILKKTNNRVLYIILIIGIVLMLFSSRSSQPVKNASAAKTTEQTELSRILSGIKGAGRVEVMVTYYGSATSRIVYDTKTRGSDTDKTAVVSGGEAITSGESFPRVKGVVVVAGGADDEQTCAAIREAVMVALDVPEYKVSIQRGG